MNRLKGITLIEVVIYLAIFGIIFLTVIQFFLAMLQFNSYTELRNGIQFESVFISQHFELSTEDAESIDAGESIFNSSNGILTLNTPTDGDIEYSLSDGRLQIDRNGSVNFLTSNRIEITRLDFEQVEDPYDSTIGYRVTITLVNRENERVTETISTSYLLD